MTTRSSPSRSSASPAASSATETRRTSGRSGSTATPTTSSRTRPPGGRHPSPIRQDIIWVVIRARGEEICRLRIPTAELLGDMLYVPPDGSGTARSEG